MECDCTTVHLFLNYVHVPHCRDIVCLPYTHSQYKAKWKAHELGTVDSAVCLRLGTVVLRYGDVWSQVSSKTALLEP